MCRRFLIAVAVLLHVVCPLFFLTSFTQNPYLIQIVTLHFVVFLTATVVLVPLWSGRPWGWVRTPLDVPLGVFAGGALLSTILAYGSVPFLKGSLNQKTLEAGVFLWVNLGVFFLSTALSQDPRRIFLRRLMLGVGGLSALYALLQYAGVDPIWGHGVNPFRGRPVSTYGNPNFLSTALVLLFPLALWEFLRAQRFLGVWAAGGTAFLCVAALIGTLTRSSYMGALAGGIVFVWGAWPLIKARPHRAWVWGALVVLLIVFWPGGRLAPDAPGPAARMIELWRGIRGKEIYTSWHQRLLLWRCAGDMWRQWPFFGCGWGHFEIFYPFFQGRYLSDDVFRGFRTHANNAHQVVLEIGSQMGGVGVGLFLWLGILTVRGQWAARSAPEDQRTLAHTYAAGLCAVLVDNFFGNVSLFFATPAFLFFWVWGQWAGELFGHGAPPHPRSLRTRTIAVMASLVCFWGGLRDVRLFRAAHAYLEGVQRVQSGDYRGGLVLLERSRALFPKDVMNAYELGNTHAQLSQWALQQGLDQTFVQHGNQALDAYSLALAANPGYDEIHYNRARVAYSLGRSTESVQGFRMALAINPTHKDAYRALGSLYERNVPTDPRTEELFERAVFYFPEEPEFQIGLDRTRRRAEQTPPPTNVSTRALP